MTGGGSGRASFACDKSARGEDEKEKMHKNSGINYAIVFSQVPRVAVTGIFIARAPSCCSEQKQSVEILPKFTFSGAASGIP